MFSMLQMIRGSTGIRHRRSFLGVVHYCIVVLVLCSSWMGRGEGFLKWNTNDNTVSADLRNLRLESLLSNIVHATGWEVMMEPGTELDISVKFSNLPVDVALEKLLRGVSFALVGESNGVMRLFVFKTSMGRATKPIKALPTGTFATGSATRTNLVPHELVIKLKPGVGVEEIAKRYGGDVVGRLDKYGLYRLRFGSEVDLQEIRRRMELDEEIESVEFNYYVSVPEVPRPVLAGFVAPMTLKRRAGSDALVVGLVDSTVQVPEQLREFFLPSIDLAGTKSGESVPTHGTAMALTILRALQSVTKSPTGVCILPINVFGESSVTTTFDVGRGVVAAVEAGASVVNLSLGTGADSLFLRSIIEDSWKQGVVIIAAAGNEPTTAPVYPAAYPEVIAVTAMDPVTGQIAPYANQGPFVDVVAPGIAAFEFGGKTYIVTGTSTASAYVSGLLAGLADKSGKKPSELKDELGVLHEENKGK